MAAGDVAGAREVGLGQARRHHRAAQDAVLVRVDAGSRRRRARPSAPRTTSAESSQREGDALLQHRRLARRSLPTRRPHPRRAPRSPGPCRRSRGGASSGWPARAKAASAAPSSAGLVDGAERRNRERRAPAMNCFLDQPVLRDLQRLGARPHRHQARPDGCAVVDGHVLELVGDGIDRCRRTSRALPCRRRRPWWCASPRRRPGRSPRNRCGS